MVIKRMFGFLKKHKKTQDEEIELDEISETSQINEKHISLADQYELLNDIIDSFTTNNSSKIAAVERGALSKISLRNDVRQYILKKRYTFDEKEFDEIYKSFEKRMWSYGILDPLIDGDDDITDIRLISENNIRATTKFGQKYTTDIKFPSKESFNRYITEIVAKKNSFTISNKEAIQIATDTVTSEKYILRIDVVGETLTKIDKNPIMHFRKLNKNKYSLEDLKDLGMFNDELLVHFQQDMDSDLGLLICAKGGEGKTTFINALIERISHNRSVLIAQESNELFSETHPEVVPVTIQTAKGDSSVNYSLANIIQKFGLLSGFDYMIVGEIKGAEAWDLANASFTGHIPITSIHTPSSEEAPDRLLELMRYAESTKNMSDGTLLATMVGFDEIVFIKDHKIQELTQIAGYDRKKKELNLNPIYKYDVNKNSYERLNDDCEKVKQKIEYSRFKINELN